MNKGKKKGRGVVAPARYYLLDVARVVRTPPTIELPELVEGSGNGCGGLFGAVHTTFG